MHQHRNDRHFALQRGGNFKRHEVGWIVQPALAGSVCDADPGRTDDCEEYTAMRHVVFNRRAEIYSGADPGDVHKNVVRAERAGEVIEKPAGFSLGVVTAITDEN